MSHGNCSGEMGRDKKEENWEVTACASLTLVQTTWQPSAD